MKMTKKLLSALLTMAMSTTVCAGAVSGIGTATATESTTMTAIDLVDDMGMGWNLGNTFDCWDTSGWTDDNETGWGNPTTTKAMITSIKSAGFNSVRIPITWYENTNSSTFDIDDAYLARIKEVIDYCRDNDMYVIINMHWDWVSNGSLWLNQGLGAKTQFLTMWKEIATYFKDYDNHLVFEDMNEVTFDYDVLEEMNQSFVDTVRATGGNNADRLLLIAGKNADLTNTCASDFDMPSDDADMLAVSIHYYTPPQWCVATTGTTWGYSDTWGTDAEVKAVYDDFNKMKTRFVDNGVPVIIGEYGVLTNDAKDTTDIVDYLKTVATAGLNTEGISTFLWDSGNCGDMQFFDRKNLTWNDTNIKTMYDGLANGDVDIPDGYVLTDRVTYTPDTMEAMEDGYNIDISGYKGLANITNVVVEGSVSNAGTASEYGVGGAVAFSAKKNGAETGGYTSESWFLNAGDTSNVVNIDGELENKDTDGNILSVDTYELEYDYLNIVKWWSWSNPSGDTISSTIDKVTIIFDQKIYVDENTGVIVPTEPTTEPTTEPVEEILWGDANESGKVDVADVVAVRRYLVNPEKYPLSAQGVLNADVQSNGGGINAQDAVAIQKNVLGIVATLPV